MSLETVLLRNQGQTLTPELITGIIAGMDYQGLYAGGFVLDAFDYDIDHHEGFIFHEKQRVAEWLAIETEQSASWGDYYAMGCDRNGEIQAAILFNNFNDVNATAHIAVKRVTKKLPQLIKHALEYAFKQCGLKRLTGMVDADNEKAIKLEMNIGFEHEATMKGAGTDGVDQLILVMWADKCRWLEEETE